MKTPDRASLAGENCAASAAPTLPRLSCGGCETDVEPSLSQNGPHIEARCKVCDRHLKFVPKREPWVSAAPPRIIQMSMFGDVA